MGQRYNTYVGYFKKRYGERLQKIVIDAGFSCPNRDGTLGTGGCTYCNNAAFHPSYSSPDKSVISQINEGIEFHRKRYRTANHYLAYFQPFSNTYAPLKELKKVYEEALSHPLVSGIVIGTRPDCIDDEKLDYFQELSKRKIVVLEYGIESVHDKTLKRINRCHTYAQSVDAITKSAARGLTLGAHFIFGLPGESKEDMMNMAFKINNLPLHSVKFHQLQIIRGTAMEKEFKEHPGDFVNFTIDEYIEFFVNFLELLKPDIYIERFAGEVPPRFVEMTPWGSIRNAELIRMLEKRLEERNTRQSAKFYPQL
ncbi:MAG TPA: TIGR01212 family radical SAM protein [Bacteroidales bacterium]|nr:TIGR01212 family radical SAM protein [Bacteroidales bacterium]HRR48775.1 TIGR01212 family radical SAM protein [Bacteroidales bacterium]HRT33525.1 TIGR01212 family radical SAM protein [Bacteroidales bacterium]HRT83636.1 TIGR01212 family radical SAM protein [Bacteroidales bacterium]